MVMIVIIFEWLLFSYCEFHRIHDKFEVYIFSKSMKWNFPFIISESFSKFLVKLVHGIAFRCDKMYIIHSRLFLH